MFVYRTVAPAAALISTADAKKHCRIDFDDDDAFVDILVQAATDYLDGYTGILGRCLINQTWLLKLTDWPASCCTRLPFPDVSAILSIKYYDGDDVQQTVDSDLYELAEDERGAFIRMRDAFSAPAVYSDRNSPIEITFVAGFGDTAADVPDAIIHAAALLVCHWYENREAVQDGPSPVAVPMTVGALTAVYRRRII